MYIRPDVGFVHCVQCWKLVTTGMYLDRRNYWSRSQQEYIQWNKTFVASHLCFVCIQLMKIHGSKRLVPLNVFLL